MVKNRQSCCVYSASGGFCFEYDTLRKLYEKGKERREWMKDNGRTEIQDINKDELIDCLTEELPVLRAKIGLSQDDLSEIIGISRQTYSSIETKKRRMSWNVFLSLILVFENNEKTQDLLENSGAFPDVLKSVLNINKRGLDNGTSGS